MKMDDRQNFFLWLFSSFSLSVTRGTAPGASRGQQQQQPQQQQKLQRYFPDASGLKVLLSPFLLKPFAWMLTPTQPLSLPFPSFPFSLTTSGSILVPKCAAGVDSPSSPSIGFLRARILFRRSSRPVATPTPASTRLLSPRGLSIQPGHSSTARQEPFRQPL